MGFDELNKVTDNSSSSSGNSGSSGGSSGGGTVGSVGIDTTGLDTAIDNSSSKIDAFIEKLKTKFGQFKTIFSPAITAWQEAMGTVQLSWETAKPSFTNGIGSIKDGFITVGSYLTNEFVPNVVNSFSENIAPIWGDVFGFSLEEAGKNFEFFGDLLSRTCKDIIKPALEGIETVATDVFDGIGKAWDTHGASLLSNISKFFSGIREDIQEFYEEVILPIWENIKRVMGNLWTESLKPLWDKICKAVGNISNNLLTLYNEVIKPVIDWIQDKIYPKIVKVVNKIVKKVGDILTSVSQVIGGIVTVLDGIIEFITGVFTGDWKKAWNGIKKIFKGIFEALVGVVRIPLNSIIGGINTVLSGITKVVNTAIKALNKINIKIPDWVPELGGKEFGFNIKEMTAPQIPKLAKGGIATAATTAIIGEAGKEAILPLENNTAWMDALVDKITMRNNAPSKIVLALDGKELGWATINSINGITKQTGNLQLTLA